MMMNENANELPLEQRVIGQDLSAIIGGDCWTELFDAGYHGLAIDIAECPDEHPPSRGTILALYKTPEELSQAQNSRALTGLKGADSVLYTPLGRNPRDVQCPTIFIQDVTDEGFVND